MCVEKSRDAPRPGDTGQFATLEEVVEFYDRGGDTPSAGTKSPAMVPLGLTQGQKDDLVEFLMSLTGDLVADELTEDTSL